MTDRKFYPLLVAWTILAVAPGLLVTLGAFGHSFDATVPSGTTVIVWVGGWLLQYAAFFWLMSIAGKQNILWWFIASGVPWLTDWTMSASPFLLFLWPALTVGTAVWIGYAESSYDSLEERGIHANGVVLQVYQPLMNVVINNVYIKRKLRLRIERSDGTAPYEAAYNGLFMLGEIPSIGDRLPLLVDPANPQHLQYDDASAAAPA
jgi:hypothetical protein